MLRYINFGALCLGFLKVSQLYSEITDPGSEDDFDTSVTLIETLMTVLTYGLFLSFGVVGGNKALVKVRGCTATLKKIMNAGEHTSLSVPQEVELAEARVHADSPSV